MKKIHFLSISSLQILVLLTTGSIVLLAIVVQLRSLLIFFLVPVLTARQGQQSVRSYLRRKPFSQLGHVLLCALGATYTQRWLAEQTFVTEQAVCYWINGYTRPRPEKLGHICVLLDLDPNHLACLAGFDRDPTALDTVLRAYQQWSMLRRLVSLAAN